MRLTRFRQKWLRQFYQDDDVRGAPAGVVEKLRKLLVALETANAIEQVGRFPGWKLHPLKGDRKGFWSLTVTGNWRLVFRYDELENSASEIELIDYH